MNLQTLLGSITSVAVLTTEGLLGVRLMSSSENMRLQVAFRGGYVNALWAVPSFATAGNLNMRHGVIILSRPKWM